ncbi:MAG: hypothetical protein RSD49_14660 [Hafnia sp.]
MKLEAYNKSIIKAQAEARVYLDQSPVKQYQQVLSKASWDDLYDKTGASLPRQNYNEAKDFLAYELAEPIATALVKAQYSEAEFFQKLNDAEEKFHYRFLAVMGREPHEVDSGWASKCLSRSKVLSAIKELSGSSGHKFCEKAMGIGFLMDQESELANKLYDLRLGDRVIGFFDDLDGKKKFKAMYQDFADNAPPHELLGVLLDYARRADGLRSHYPIDNVINHVVAKAAAMLFNDPNIGISDIARLRDLGVIKPTLLWDTEHFNQHYAPVLTDEFVERVRHQVSGRYQDEVFLELKDKLSRQEILSHIMRSSRMFELEGWKYAMAAFEVHTGERLTFREARDIKPSNTFNIARTQVYSDRTDRLMDASSYRAIKVGVERVRDQDYKYDGNEKAVTITIDCKSLVLTSISEAMQRELGRYPFIKEYASTPDGVWYELAVDSRDCMAEAKSIAKQLERRLDGLNKVAMLPGDFVKVSHEDAAEHELSNGTVAVVTDVDIDGDVKLKGDAAYYPAELFEIRKKYQPEQKMGMSLGG